MILTSGFILLPEDSDSRGNDADTSNDADEPNVVPAGDYEEEEEDDEYGTVPNTSNDTIYYSDSSDDECGAPAKRPIPVVECFHVVPSFWDPED